MNKNEVNNLYSTYIDNPLHVCLFWLGVVAQIIVWIAVAAAGADNKHETIAAPYGDGIEATLVIAAVFWLPILANIGFLLYRARKRGEQVLDDTCNRRHYY